MLNMMKKWKTYGACFMVLVMLCSLLMIPCNVNAKGKMKLNKQKVILMVGQKAALKVKNVPKNQKVKWSSNKKKVAIVTNKGMVYAKKAGTAKITAKVAGKKMTCKITVKSKKKTEKTTEEITTQQITTQQEVVPTKPTNEVPEKQDNITTVPDNTNNESISKDTGNSDEQSLANDNRDSSENKSLESRDNSSEQDISDDTDEHTKLENTEGKDRNTVASLEKIIKTLIEKGASVSVDLDSDDYVWDDGKLVTIWWYDKNIIGSISFSGLPDLEEIYCGNNAIEDLNISNNPKLTFLNCAYNKLSKIDVGENVLLEDVSINDNEITELDVSHNISLKYLYCYSNKLQKLEISNNNELESLSCFDNNIKELDLSNNKKLEFLLYDDDSVKVTGYNHDLNDQDKTDNTETSEDNTETSEDNTEASEDNTETSEEDVEDNTVVPSISYQAHVQNTGWLNSVKGGEVAGTTGKDKQLEAIRIFLNDAEGNSAIKYRAYIENTGWQAWKESGQDAGTTGEDKRIEAIQIQLIGEYADKYDIYYSAHIAQFGWLGWAKNGDEAGSKDLSLRMEAIKILLVEKDGVFDVGGRHIVLKPETSYRVHSANIGWRAYVPEGEITGAASSRLEALEINMSNSDGSSAVSYRAHCSNTGWQAWKSSGETAGTTNKSRAIEAVEIKLSGQASKDFDIYYRVYVADIGWLGWASNGETAGTTGGGRQAEAIVIKLVYKGASFERGGTAYRELTQNSLTKTADDAIAWCKSILGQSIDKDGAYGAQCVDLILAYYDYLGVARASGNGADYSWNSLPAGWTRVQGGTPQKGDILVYGSSASNQYGHVAIYESDYSTYHQNFGGSYVQNVTDIRYTGFTNPYWGYIRPNWAN